MKIRHKTSGFEVDFPDGVYEVIGPTQQDRWQDVTGECEFRICKDGTALSHHWESARPEIGCNVMVNQATGYRLRKVEVVLKDNLVTPNSPLDTMWAFIVERKLTG